MASNASGLTKTESIGLGNYGDQWINCHKAMPTSTEPVLCYAPRAGKDKQFVVCWYTTHGDRLWRVQGQEEPYMWTITHWQPLHGPVKP